jgi:hypothetical protein
MPWGPRLLKKTSVQARVDELQQMMATATVTRAMLSREFVLRELMDNTADAPHLYFLPNEDQHESDNTHVAATRGGGVRSDREVVPLYPLPHLHARLPGRLTGGGSLIRS